MEGEVWKAGFKGGGGVAACVEFTKLQLQLKGR